MSFLFVAKIPSSYIIVALLTFTVHTIAVVGDCSCRSWQLLQIGDKCDPLTIWDYTNPNAPLSAGQPRGICVNSLLPPPHPSAVSCLPAAGTKSYVCRHWTVDDFPPEACGYPCPPKHVCVVGECLMSILAVPVGGGCVSSRDCVLGTMCSNLTCVALFTNPLQASVLSPAQCTPGTIMNDVGICVDEGSIMNLTASPCCLPPFVCETSRVDGFGTCRWKVRTGPFRSPQPQTVPIASTAQAPAAVSDERSGAWPLGASRGDAASWRLQSYDAVALGCSAVLALCAEMDSAAAIECAVKASASGSCSSHTLADFGTFAAPFAAAAEEMQQGPCFSLIGALWAAWSVTVGGKLLDSLWYGFVCCYFGLGIHEEAQRAAWDPVFHDLRFEDLFVNVTRDALCNPFTFEQNNSVNATTSMSYSTVQPLKTSAFRFAVETSCIVVCGLLGLLLCWLAVSVVLQFKVADGPPPPQLPGSSAAIPTHVDAEVLVSPRLSPGLSWSAAAGSMRGLPAVQYHSDDVSPIYAVSAS